jgi:hypothetical protein
MIYKNRASLEMKYFMCGATKKAGKTCSCGAINSLDPGVLPADKWTIYSIHPTTYKITDKFQEKNAPPYHSQIPQHTYVINMATPQQNLNQCF